MATDTARVQLELASGRNEITAPFYQTAQRRRKLIEQDAVSVDAPVAVPPADATPTVIAVPLAAAATVAASAPEHEFIGEQRGRTPWIAFAIALISVGVAVWWVMAQRMPDIDPSDVVARNLNDAQTAMADGRYTDPPERSAFHYYSTVLAVDPSNADAIAGIDAIADRHLSNARALLAKRRIAEAGVALEKARRVRPDHNDLAVLDIQWRAELRKILAAATAIAPPTTETAVVKPVVAKSRDASVRPTPTPERLGLKVAAVEPAPAPLAPKVAAVEPPPAPLALKVADVDSVAAALVASQATQPASALPIPESQPVTNVVEEPVAAPTAVVPAPSSEPKLIRMVQPEYPQEALLRGMEGWVDVSLQVSASGDVIAPRVEETSRGRMFNRAALAAVEQWKYQPRSDGTTSERVRVRLKFQRSN